MVSYPHNPEAVFGRRVREARERRRWSQADLARRLDEVADAKLDRTTIARIEKGKRGVTLGDLYAFAVALDVAPVHLLVPLEDDETMTVTTKLGAPAPLVRDWIRGGRPLWNEATGQGDMRAFLTERPESELVQEYGTRFVPPPADPLLRELLGLAPELDERSRAVLAKAVRQIREQVDDEFAAEKYLRHKEGDDA